MMENEFDQSKQVSIIITVFKIEIDAMKTRQDLERSISAKVESAKTALIDEISDKYPNLK